MSAQLTIFFLFFGGLQGLLFTLFLVRKKLHRNGYIFLLLYLVVMLFQVTLNLMSKGWLMENWRILYELSYQLPFLYGPLIYLFTRQLLQRQSFKWTDLVHFIPFVIVAFFFIIGFSNSESPLVLFPFLLAKFRLILQLASLYVYHYMALQNWMDNQGAVQRFSPGQQFQWRWLKKFIYSSFFVCMAIAILNYFMVILYPQLNYVRPGFFVLTLFIYWISYEALYHPDVFSVVKGYADDAIAGTENLPRLTVHRPLKKYLKSNLTEDESNRIVNSLITLMQEQKPFLDPGISIEGLAAMVDSNRHHLSQVLNEKLKMSFYDYINHFRVGEAKLLLTNPERSAKR